VSADDTADSPGAAAPRERFYQGTIVRLYPGTERGILHTGNGRDVLFVAADVRILGTSGGFAAIREGMRVGFDLGWTSRGMRVTVIRVPDAVGEPPA
jgi:hypothetical protein